jgi:hypothetical protein
MKYKPSNIPLADQIAEDLIAVAESSAAGQHQECACCLLPPIYGLEYPTQPEGFASEGFWLSQPVSPTCSDRPRIGRSAVSVLRDLSFHTPI